MSEVCTNPKYRYGTEVLCVIAIVFYMSGVAIIPIVSNSIFSQTTVSPEVAVQVMSVTSLIGACTGPFVINLGTMREILLYGYAASTALLLLITSLFIAGDDEAAFYVIIVLTFLYTCTMGSYSFPYNAAIGNGSQVAVS